MEVNIDKINERINSLNITQHLLASRSGLSRPTINAILKGKPIRKKTAELLAKGLGVELQDLLAQSDARASYLNWLAAQCAELDFRGLSAAHPTRMSLPSIHIEIAVRPESDDDAPEEECHSSWEERESLDSSIRSQRFMELRDPRIVLLGDPGSGKTSTLRYKAWQMSTAYRADDPGLGKKVPIFVKAAEWSSARQRSGNLGLIDYLGSVARRGRVADPTSFLTSHLEAGNCVVMIDGIDEIGEPEARNDIVRELRRIVLMYPKNHFVITSRRVGFNSQPWRECGFKSFSVRPLTGSDIQDFARKWSAGHHGHASSAACSDCSEKALDLTDAIASNSAVREIATNPLMLTILAILKNANVTLPRRRVELYERIVDTLLITWEQTKAVSQPGDVIHGIPLDAREYKWLLAGLALEMQRNSLTLAPRWWVSDVFERFLEHDLGMEHEHAKDATDQIVTYLSSRCGLLAERGVNLFAFSHLTFQEYLAALALAQGSYADSADSNPARRIAPHVFDPRWREVVRLLASSLSPHQASSVLRMLLTDPTPAGRILQRGPLLALACLSDGTVVADKRMLDDLFSGLERTGATEWLGVTMDILCGLAALKGTRYEERGRQAREAIKQSAVPLLSARDVRTLYLHDLDHEPRGEDRVVGSLLAVPTSSGEISLVRAGKDLRNEDPELWARHVSDAITKGEDKVRSGLLSQLTGGNVENPVILASLTRMLQSRSKARIRLAAARAISRSQAAVGTARSVLTKILRQDKDLDMRRECARALGRIACDNEETRSVLEALLEADQPEKLRIGAIDGLSSVAFSDNRIANRLMTILLSKQEDPHVRIHCAHALTPRLSEQNELRDVFVEWLHAQDDDSLRREAAAIIGMAIANGETPYDDRQLKLIESILTAAASPSAARTLHALCDFLEIRTGSRVEAVILDSLGPDALQLPVAAVFGSFAKSLERPPSDIDLLLVGDITLGRVSSGLREAERILGRQINPVIYSTSDLARRFEERDPFVVEILKGPMIFVKGDRDELGKLVQATVD